MLEKIKTLGIGLIALILFVSAPVWAAGSHEGKVVEAGKGKLTMTSMTGDNQHSHDVAADAKITCEGQPCQLDTLQAGDVITVTLDQKDGKSVVIEIKKTAGSTQGSRG
jgi:hypothetical protein